MPFTASDICKILLAIILPPLGVFLERGCGADFLINILLTILGYIPVSSGVCALHLMQGDLFSFFFLLTPSPRVSSTRSTLYSSFSGGARPSTTPLDAATTARRFRRLTIPIFAFSFVHQHQSLRHVPRWSMLLASFEHG
ncbi:plasma membrane proteolipid Pmp3 [Exserohilum turcicum]